MEKTNKVTTHLLYIKNTSKDFYIHKQIQKNKKSYYKLKLIYNNSFLKLSIKFKFFFQVNNKYEVVDVLRDSMVC